MDLRLPEGVAARLNLTEAQLRVEVACRLFDAGILDAGQASAIAELERERFETELRRRSIPLYRPTPQDVAQDAGFFAKDSSSGQGRAA